MTHSITGELHTTRLLGPAFSSVSMIITFVLFIAVDLNAEKIYTWTDERGALHITNKPPPKNAELRDAIEYQSEPRNTSTEDGGRQELSEGQPVESEGPQESPGIDARVEDARKEALESRTRAEEAARREEEYLNKLGRNKKMRKRNKYKLDKAAEYAKATEEQARLAEERAIEVEREAETARYPTGDADE